MGYEIKITIYLEEGKVVARLEVVLILLLADVATTEDALWAVVVFVVAVVATEDSFLVVVIVVFAGCTAEG